MIIYCDSGQNKLTNKTSVASVTDSQGNDLIKEYANLFKDFTIISLDLPRGVRFVAPVTCDSGTTMKNNTGELQALIMALRIAINVYDSKATIKCDSTLVVSYWSKGHINPKTRQKMDPVKLALINECVILRTKLELNGGRVEWVSGDDNVADLGCGKHPKTNIK